MGVHRGDKDGVGVRGVGRGGASHRAAQVGMHTTVTESPTIIWYNLIRLGYRVE